MHTLGPFNVNGVLPKANADDSLDDHDERGQYYQIAKARYEPTRLGIVN